MCVRNQPIYCNIYFRFFIREHQPYPINYFRSFQPLSVSIFLAEISKSHRRCTRYLGNGQISYPTSQLSSHGSVLRQRPPPCKQRHIRSEVKGRPQHTSTHVILTPNHLPPDPPTHPPTNPPSCCEPAVHAGTTHPRALITDVFEKPSAMTWRHYRCLIAKCLFRFQRPAENPRKANL